MKNLFYFACHSTLVVMVLCFNTANAQQYDWAKQAGGAFEAVANAVTTDPNGNVIVVGYFFGTADLDPGPGVFQVTATGQDINAYIQKLDGNGNFLWGGSVDSDTTTIMHAMQTDAAGNCFILGETWGRADFDIGAGIDTLGSNRSVFIMRIDAAGNYRWAKLLEGPQIQYQCADLLAMDNSANLYLAGNFMNTVDFDLGPGVHNLTSQGQRDGYIAKYDSTGALIWANQLGGPLNEEVHGIYANGMGVYVTGEFRDTIDMDPGLGTLFLVNPNFGNDNFVGSYTLSGNVNWAKQLDANNAISFINNIRVDGNGEVVASGTFNGTFNVDPSGGTQAVTSNGGSDIFVLKLDASGNFTWGWSIGGPANDQVYGLATDDTASIYVATSFSNTMDFDPGAGVLQLTAANFDDAAFLKLDPGGNLNWVAQVGGTSQDYAFEVYVDHLGQVYGAGSFVGTVDFDPSPTGTTLLTTASNSDGYVFKWNQDSCSNFFVRIDSVADVRCATSVGFVAGTAMGGQLPYAYSWNTTPATLDSFATVGSSGIYTLTATDNDGCQSTRSALVGGSTSVSGFDLEVNLVAPVFVPGLYRTLTLDAFNSGCLLISGQLQLILDPQVTYQSATPTPSNVVGDTLFWNFPAMNYDSAHFIAHIVVQVNTTAQAGDTLRFGAIATPVAGDEQPLDNIRTDYAFQVRASLDPNQKSVYPPGACAENYVLLTAPLTYTIQFQNTGTFEALEVAILDTLDPDLDMATVAIKGSSHPMITEVLPGNVLRFVFHDIHLPDSASNEPASHGYVIYEILPASSIVTGTEVYNGSAIYFDFNAPVITNVVMNTLVNVVPACPVGIWAEHTMNTLRIFPNPATSSLHLQSDIALGNIQVVNMLGQIVYQQENLQSRELAVDVQRWMKGIYLVAASGTTRRIVVE